MEGNSFYLDLNVIEENILSVKYEMSVDWHKRLGHYNFESLKMLHDCDMVKGMPKIHASDKMFEKPQICDLNGKNRDSALYSMKFNNVYVKNSAESTTDKGLKDVFTEHGAKSKCFEFVNFEKAEDVDEAIKTLNSKEIDGKKCYVGKWYMKTGGAIIEGNPDGYLGQNRVDKSLVHYDLKTKALPVARLEFLR